jgi:iron transport multicopper oxidase
MMQGLAMEFVEDPLTFQDQFSISQNQIDVCETAGLSWEGNAAGNTEDYLDLKGQNKPPSFIPGAFTTCGIMALVFSCICAVVGIISISIYGISDLKFTMHESGLGGESAATQGRESASPYRD